MIRLLNPIEPTSPRTPEDAQMLVDFAGQVLSEARDCGDIRFGDWLFLARLGEFYGLPETERRTGNRDTIHSLWTIIAKLDLAPDPRPDWLPNNLTLGLVDPRPDSVRIHEQASDALEIIAATDGLAGIAIHLDRRSPRNDDLIWVLTCRLEPRHPDDEGPVVWYGRPPTWPSGPSRDETAHNAAGDRP